MVDTCVGDDECYSLAQMSKQAHTLYPEAQMSVLTALVKYFSWFTNNRGVIMQHHPKNNLLPDSKTISG